MLIITREQTMKDAVNIYLGKKDTQNKPTEEQQAKAPEVTEEIQQLQQEIDEKVDAMPKEFGGRTQDKGLEPTRYGDWELKGRCIDF